MKHLLARLFEFLYISVYRETTFKEIFKNADPNVFLEAVGITKKDFEILNKYKVFQEEVLNNYIHDFFDNESSGSKLDLKDEEVRKQYRNSFDWLAFGLESDNVTQKGTLENKDVTSRKSSLDDECLILDLSSHENKEHQENIKNEPEPTLLDKIKDPLSSRQMKSSKIASQFGASKKEVNRVLYSHHDLFTKDIFFNWRMK